MFFVMMEGCRCWLVGWSVSWRTKIDQCPNETPVSAADAVTYDMYDTSRTLLPFCNALTGDSNSHSCAQIMTIASDSMYNNNTPISLILSSLVQEIPKALRQITSIISYHTSEVYRRYHTWTRRHDTTKRTAVRCMNCFHAENKKTSPVLISCLLRDAGLCS